ATRWIVQKSIVDRFASEAVAALKATKIGPGLDSQTQMGPLVSETQRQRVLDYFEKGKREKNVEVILDEKVPAVPGCEKGYFVSPYLLAGSSDNVCAREEIFGPAAFLI